MFRFLTLLAFLAAFLSRAPAHAGKVYVNAWQSAEYATVFDKETGYPKQTILLKVPRWIGPRLKSVTIRAKLEQFGQTGIENTTGAALPPSTWAVGVVAKLRHAYGPLIASKRFGRQWSSLTTQSVDSMLDEYYGEFVGQCTGYDGVTDWQGDSGREWRMQGYDVWEQTFTADLAQWSIAHVEGQHALTLELDPKWTLHSPNVGHHVPWYASGWDRLHYAQFEFEY